MVITQRTSAVSFAGLLLAVGIILSGCIQPIPDAEQTQNALATLVTYTPTIIVLPTNPPAVAPTNPPVQPNPQPTVAIDSTTATVAGFIQSRGDAANNLVVWNQRPLGPDQLYGFSYTNLAGLPCAGYLLTGFINGVWQPTNGGVACASQAGMTSLAGVTFFLTSDGQSFTIAFGRSDDPTVSAFGIVYEDSSADSVSSLNGGFLFVRAGIAGVNVITAIDSLGNTVIPNIPQLPPI